MESVPLSALSVPGRLYEIESMGFSTGGSVSNTGLALYRLGVNVRLMATVGDDLIGQITLNLLESRDPSLTQMIRRQPGQASSYTIALTPQRVDRIFLHCVGPNKNFGIADIDFSQVANAKIFHLGYPPYLPRLFQNDGEPLREMFQRIKGDGVVTSIDMALPDPNTDSGRIDWMPLLRQTLPYVDIYLPSIDETLFIQRRADYDAWVGQIPEHMNSQYLDDLADELLDMGAAVVGFKLGELGMYIKTASAVRLERLQRLPVHPNDWANQTVYSPAFEVAVIGTTGAGDSAYAGFLTALLHGMTPQEAVQMACAVGACNVEAADSTSGIRTWDDTLARIRDGWALRKERVTGL
jgi:sugar/nucleoside kinase (ribokinase family)